MAKTYDSASSFLEDVAFERFKYKRLTFTPVFAGELAEECGAESHLWNDPEIREIASAMADGLWNPDRSYFPVVFDPVGVCLDGMKRIVACALSGKNVQMNVLVATDRELDCNREAILKRIRGGVR